MQWQQALLLVALMRQTSVLPVVVPSRRRSVLVRRLGIGSRPDVVSISALISACEKAQQWQQALGFLAVIHRSAVLPNVISYIAAISACERGKQWQQALRLLALMQQTPVLPNVISCSAVVSACGSGQLWQQAASKASMASQPSSVPAKEASNGSRLCVFWR